MTSTPGPGPGTGDYPDRDLSEGDVEPVEGAYTDQETPPEQRGEEPDLRGPDDYGEYTDSDVVAERRPPPPEGGYTSKDNDSSGTDQAEENRHG